MQDSASEWEDNVSGVLMIDPPFGWKYGFPKPAPKDCDDIKQWLVKNHYPQKEIDRLGDHFYCRYWERKE